MTDMNIEQGFVQSFHAPGTSSSTGRILDQQSIKTQPVYFYIDAKYTFMYFFIVLSVCPKETSKTKRTSNNPLTINICSMFQSLDC